MTLFFDVRRGSAIFAVYNMFWFFTRDWLLVERVASRCAAGVFLGGVMGAGAHALSYKIRQTSRTWAASAFLTVMILAIFLNGTTSGAPVPLWEAFGIAINLSFFTGLVVWYLTFPHE